MRLGKEIALEKSLCQTDESDGEDGQLLPEGELLEQTNDRIHDCTLAFATRHSKALWIPRSWAIGHSRARFNAAGAREPHRKRPAWHPCSESARPAQCRAAAELDRG